MQTEFRKENVRKICINSQLIWKSIEIFFSDNRKKKCRFYLRYNYRGRMFYFIFFSSFLSFLGYIYFFLSAFTLICTRVIRFVDVVLFFSSSFISRSGKKKNKFTVVNKHFIVLAGCVIICQTSISYKCVIWKLYEFLFCSSFVFFFFFNFYWTKILALIHSD